MPKWQYLVVFIEDSETAQDQPAFDNYLDADRYTERLNAHGEAGWELVSFTWEATGAKATFKRLQPPPPAPIEGASEDG